MFKSSNYQIFVVLNNINKERGKDAYKHEEIIYVSPGTASGRCPKEKKNYAATIS
jgi:hypothetical protein